MGILDIFRNKKSKHNIYCKFNFDKAPELLDVYNEYKELRLKATSLSMKDVKNKKYEKAAAARDEFGKTVFAKMIWDKFNPISPTLYNGDTEEYEEWVKVFDKDFDELTDIQKYFLIGLVERDYIYELPKEYYKN